MAFAKAAGGQVRATLSSPSAERPSFIETQFPVSLLSKESYHERKSHVGQTITSLGKWWGRKPLTLVRAVILGLLMPASHDQAKDRNVFLALLTMDADGLRRRKNRNIPLKDVYRLLNPGERKLWFSDDSEPRRPQLKKATPTAKRRHLQLMVFDRLNYDEKLSFCSRPEQIDGPSVGAWEAINAHLGTAAESLPNLVRELGIRRFGCIPRVGDAFCGGGSVPFEASRIGCEAYGSDLSPVAALLTWGALNIIGGGATVAQSVHRAQERTFSVVDHQITSWRIEHNDIGWRADVFLYCIETKCPECGWLVPLASSWVIGEKTRTVAKLVPLPGDRRFDIRIRSGATAAAMAAARATGTVRESRLVCPNPACRSSTSMAAVRGDQRGEGVRGYGLRLWKSDDLGPRPTDVFQERLYCVRWRLPRLDGLLWDEQKSEADRVHIPAWVSLEDAINGLSTLLDPGARRQLAALRSRDWVAEDSELAAAHHELHTAKAGDTISKLAAFRSRVASLEAKRRRREEALFTLTKVLPGTVYRDARDDDLTRERKVLSLLRENFADWQRKGLLPSRAITPGSETSRLIRERGWTHWHHLFSPRQLLIHGLIQLAINQDGLSQQERVHLLLGVGRIADWDSKLCRWGTGAARESIAQSFYNQAFNTLYNFPTKSFPLLWGNFAISHESITCDGETVIEARDCRDVAVDADVWITDPPYADAINYHELSELCLSWYETRLLEVFPHWYTDSKRAFAVQGMDANFRRSMVDCYRNLTEHMPDDGFHVVMFTHQNASVWADLTLILWAAGLRVTAAWTIATETASALKEGNYVQGTVLMVLRKQTTDDTAFLDEVVPEVEAEVEHQLASMRDLDERDAPNFSDADYQLAAYAAALRVLTNYRAIEDVDVSYELSRERRRDEGNPLAHIIEDGVRTASNFLVPAGLPAHVWIRLAPEEKLYLKGLEVESHGDYRAGVYQEFARGFGVADYRRLLHTGKANETRLKTPSELQRADLADAGLLRHALYAVWRAAATGDVTGSLTWLHAEFTDYWPQREAIGAVLRYLSALDIDHWRTDAGAARLVAGAVENDHV